jgi:hypothetical protein
MRQFGFSLRGTLSLFVCGFFILNIPEGQDIFLDSHSSYTDLGHIITCGWDRVMRTRNAVPIGVRSDSAAIDHAISDKERNRRIRRRSGLPRLINTHHPPAP